MLSQGLELLVPGPAPVTMADQFEIKNLSEDDILLTILNTSGPLYLLHSCSCMYDVNCDLGSSTAPQKYGYIN